MKTLAPRRFLPSLLSLAALAASAVGCGGRDVARYEADTSALLDTRQPQLEACYRAELGRNPHLSGKITVTFTIEKHSGRVIQLGWDRSRTTVDDTLATCVVQALGGLVLPDPDPREGRATFSYTFRQD